MILTMVSLSYGLLAFENSYIPTYDERFVIWIETSIRFVFVALPQRDALD